MSSCPPSNGASRGPSLSIQPTAGPPDAPMTCSSPAGRCPSWDTTPCCWSGSPPPGRRSRSPASAPTTVSVGSSGRPHLPRPRGNRYAPAPMAPAGHRSHLQRLGQLFGGCGRRPPSSLSSRSPGATLSGPAPSTCVLPRPARCSTSMSRSRSAASTPPRAGVTASFDGPQILTAAGGPRRPPGPRRTDARPFPRSPHRDDCTPPAKCLNRRGKGSPRRVETLIRPWPAAARKSP